MEITVAVIAIVIAGWLLMFGRLKTASTILAAVAFGPVAWRYSQTGDSSLVYELLFRAVLLAGALWVARSSTKADQQAAVPR